jgi:flagellum-specific ATP synthase
MPLGDMHGIGPGGGVTPTGEQLRVTVGDDLLGRVVDALGNPIDGLADEVAGVPRPTLAPPPSPLERGPIDERISLGVRSLDALVPCGRGQRLGIFAGSGVGKSSLLGMIARSTSAQVNVICLVGERGREVREFIERDLGPEGMARSVVVVATSDQPALVRIKAAFTATTIAEHFRDAGCDVMLMMDSVTRFAMAQREVGLAIGEPPATRGYTPSVFALLPKLLERSGTAPNGTITALYTVLVDGDDMTEPIADAVRSILDGHVVLSRHLAHAGHYPAIDVLASVSRLVGEVTSRDVRSAGDDVRRLMAAFKEKEDLIAIGAYQAGADPLADAAIAARRPIEAFLRQRVDDPSTAEEAERGLLELAAYAELVRAPDPLAAAAAAPAHGAPGEGGTPLHSAIPPLNLSP